MAKKKLDIEADFSEDSVQPMTPPMYKTRSYTPFYVILLIVMSFLLGALTVKSQYTTSTPTVDQGQNQAPQPQKPTKVNVKNGHLPANGDEKAKVTIVEFSDFQCPYCKQFVDQSYIQLKKDYIDTGKVKMYFRHFPLSAIHPHAQKAAEATECANEQGKFWDFHDKLFATQPAWSAKATADTLADFTAMAGELGLNTANFSTCVTSGKYAAKVQEDLDAGAKAQVSGTPTFMINGQFVEGAVPYASLKAVIDEQLAK